MLGFETLGRHRQFDKSEVLEKATQVFIEKGFEATSIQDLIDAMGINRASLYDTFVDKETLFLEVLDRYDNLMYEEFATLIDANPIKLEALQEWFYRVVEQGSNRRHPGCLMVNSTIERALRDEDCKARAVRNFRRSEEVYFNALTKAAANGEIEPGRAPRDRHALGGGEIPFPSHRLDMRPLQVSRVHRQRKPNREHRRKP